MPFTALFLTLTLLVVAGIFAFAYYKLGLKVALILSGSTFGVLVALFLLILNTALNNM
jgi:hypothetical protein